MNGEVVYDGHKRRKKRAEEAIFKEIAELEKELSKLREVERKGWIVLDFPTNFA